MSKSKSRFNVKIIGFVFRSLSKLTKISNKILENQLKMKEIRNGKDEESEELISQSRKQEQQDKEGLREYFSFERRKRMLKSKPPEFDQFIKLSKR